ncbi:S-layer homology domain-containing protein [Texcoconibacillus texcoconensis]|uniref:SLH domain-containing protein n=1 Tax=Texcoconibacillus texcoconensis TaxID=1095777 RepID=A0A840QT85_9BACI|nr:S-layer homology domain-containing protein [Texcoconibacillus texcoconensis]MBB5174574.1 hypothetical protein [Texcoconibacillus texcoconensis]
MNITKPITTIALVAILAIPATTVTANDTFTDIADDHFAKQEIQTLVDAEVITGYPDDTFKPDNNIDRADAATMFTRALDLDEPTDQTETNFTDIDEDAYYTDAVHLTTAAGIFQGNTHNEFNPTNPLTREEMATVLVRSFDLEPKAKDNDTLTDIQEANHSHQENIITLYHHGLTEGRSNNQYEPKANVTRAEFAVFLHRALTTEDDRNDDDDGENDDQRDNDENTDETDEPDNNNGSGDTDDTTPPEATTATMTTAAGETIEADTQDNTLTFDLTHLDGEDEITSGTIDVSKDSTLEFTNAPTSDLEQPQELSEGTNELSVAQFLSDLDADIDLIRDAQGDFTARGHLTDDDGNQTPIQIPVHVE